MIVPMNEMGTGMYDYEYRTSTYSSSSMSTVGERRSATVMYGTAVPVRTKKTSRIIPYRLQVMNTLIKSNFPKLPRIRTNRESWEV